MIYTDETKKAMRIAYDSHKEQVDISGIPYIFHPIHLAEQMTDEVATCVALLHDVVEDTPMTFEELEGLGIREEVIVALKLLTHEETTPYMDYIRAIKQSKNRAALMVKLADLYHNSDKTRLIVTSEKDSLRNEKYKEAIEYLESGEDLLKDKVYVEVK